VAGRKGVINGKKGIYIVGYIILLKEMFAMEGAVHTEQSKKTPLYDVHVDAGGKIVDFHGWLLPIQYNSILKEHESVRTAAGLFDVSHMGEIEVRGPDALNFLQMVLTNNIDAKPGKAVYSPMCYPSGGTVDDLIVYKLTNDRYLLVVNAANTDKDFDWLTENKQGNVEIENHSSRYAQLALQGPFAERILQRLVDTDLSKLRFFSFINDVEVGGIKVLLSRTGYTGEDGFELYCAPDDAVKLWNLLMEKGEGDGLVPAGLGARDTLRLEAALPLYGQELSEDISPVMAGLNRFIKTDKGEFIGREALAAQLEGSLRQKIAGFEMVDKTVPRTGYEVYCCDEKIGHVTSGGFFPTLKKNMGLALLNVECAEEGNIIEIKVRDKMYKARIIKLPFLKK